MSKTVVIIKQGELVVNKDFGMTYKDLQEVVASGGEVNGTMLEAIGFPVDTQRGITIWLNEEGKLIGLPPTVALLRGNSIVDVTSGDIVITASDDEGETVGLNDEELDLVLDTIKRNTGLKFHGVTLNYSINYK